MCLWQHLGNNHGVNSNTPVFAMRFWCRAIGYDCCIYMYVNARRRSNLAVDPWPVEHFRSRYRVGRPTGFIILGLTMVSPDSIGISAVYIVANFAWLLDCSMKTVVGKVRCLNKETILFSSSLSLVIELCG